MGALGSSVNPGRNTGPGWCQENADSQDNNDDMLTGRRGTFRAARSSWVCLSVAYTAPAQLPRAKQPRNLAAPLTGARR